VGKGLGKLKGWEGSNFFFEDFTLVKIARGREKFLKKCHLVFFVQGTNVTICRWQLLWQVLRRKPSKASL
jgi:hypothetical protein